MMPMHTMNLQLSITSYIDMMKQSQKPQTVEDDMEDMMKEMKGRIQSR
jgi:hypothetical protein